MSDTKVKALRGFRGITSDGFTEVKKGQTVTVPLLFARELVASKKAEIVEKAEAKPATTKGEKNAG